ncbi:hypothetical protein [Rheinheimera soli]|uniref:hypothetical protein n=1 Tax=Rheinheimera soli TaxID=443616 RepID=UPI001E5D33A0|nr:hypothetical protein [Rheinheimera soli]
MLLSEFKVQNVQSDIFSSRISQKVSDGILNERESLLDELSWQYSTLEAFSLLVYEENQANWRNKRGYSLSDKHNHQIAVSRLMENEELLINAIKKYAQGQFEKGTTDLGKALMKFSKYLVDEVNPAILLSVKKLIGWGKFDDQISIGVIFLSKLYGLEQENFKQYLQNHVSTTGFKNRAIPASLAAKVVSEYLEFK